MKKTELHPRNRHRDRYDFPALIQSLPELGAFVRENEYGDRSIDFADPRAVKSLNRAILKHFYRVSEWDIPPGYLCPPIPGRADYLHHIADLLAQTHGGKIPRGPDVRILDIGTGANCIYPLLGNREYGWSFVGTETDSAALASARRNIDKNPDLSGAIELRLQKDRSRIFEGVVGRDELFDLSVCNPPFHSSAEQAAAGSRRKWNQLGKLSSGKKPPTLNFGGTPTELWCEGGEVAFVTRMIEESSRIRECCRWFSTLISKEEHLSAIENALQRSGAKSETLLEMAQGQKKSRIVAWTF